MQTPISVEVEFWNQVSGAQLHVTLHLYTEQQIVAFTTGSLQERDWRDRPLPTGLFRRVCHIPGNLLYSGLHRVLLLVVEDGSRVIFRHDDALVFEVLDLSERHGAWYGKEPGVVQPILEWTTEFLDSVLLGE